MDLREQIYRKIDETLGDIVEDLSLGHYTIEEYRAITGKIAGLRLAVEIISETYREYIGNDSRNYPSS